MERSTVKWLAPFGAITVFGLCLLVGGCDLRLGVLATLFGGAVVAWAAAPLVRSRLGRVLVVVGDRPRRRAAIGSEAERARIF